MTDHRPDRSQAMTPTREAALPLADAPKDHTMLWLLVDYSGDGANPIEDDILGWTIGHNGFDHTGVDEWEFAGWSWEQDCFTQGVGNVVGWYPLQRPDQQPDTPTTEPQWYVEGLEGQDINDAISDALGDAMDCTRVWEAWHYGTMSDEDFVLVRDDAARVEEIVAAINNALAARPAPQPAADTRLVTVAQLTELHSIAEGYPSGMKKQRELIRAIIGAATPAPTYQSRVKPWLDSCFGPEIAGDKTERNHRFLEEALELVQSGGCTASEAHQLVDYVYGRPVGEMEQEIGGVMNTLAALCLANGLDMHEAGEVELARVWTKVEKIRAKQAAKPKHSPLPEHTPAPSDKIAESARVLDGEYYADQLKPAAADAVKFGIPRASFLLAAELVYDASLRALAGKGETP